MRLVGYYHHVAAVGQQVVAVALLWLEFLYGGEDHTSRLHLQQVLQMVAAVGLHRRLAQQLFGGYKSLEELVVEVVTVGDDHHGGVVQPLHYLAGVEHHRKRLAATLRVPHHAGAMVAGLLFLDGLESEILWRFGSLGYSAVDACGAEGGLHGFVDGIVLVVGGHLLHRGDGQLAGSLVLVLVFLEDGERAHKVEQCLFVQHAAQQHLQLAHQMRGHGFAVLALPGRIAAQPRRQRARTGFQAIGDND